MRNLQQHFFFKQTSGKAQLIVKFSRCFCSKRVALFVTFAETLAVYLRVSVDRGLKMVAVVAKVPLFGGRLRVHWRHEQLSIRMAAESALHHSVQRPLVGRRSPTGSICLQLINLTRTILFLLRPT